MPIRFKYLERSADADKIIAAKQLLPGGLYGGEWVSIEELLSDLGIENIYTFSKTLGDVLTTTIPAIEHNLPIVHDVKLFTSDLQEISIVYAIDVDQNITINSNISLLNKIIKIF